MRFLLALVLIVVLAAGGAYVVAGRSAPPTNTISKPEKFVGQSTPMEVAVKAPEARLNAVRIELEQNGKRFPLYGLGGDAGKAEIRPESPDTLRITRDIG